MCLTEPPIVDLDGSSRLPKPVLVMRSDSVSFSDWLLMDFHEACALVLS